MTTVRCTRQLVSQNTILLNLQKNQAKSRSKKKKEKINRHFSTIDELRKITLWKLQCGVVARLTMNHHQTHTYRHKVNHDDVYFATHELYQHKRQKGKLMKFIFFVLRLPRQYCSILFFLSTFHQFTLFAIQLFSMQRIFPVIYFPFLVSWMFLHFFRAFFSLKFLPMLTILRCCIRVYVIWTCCFSSLFFVNKKARIWIWTIMMMLLPRVSTLCVILSA